MKFPILTMITLSLTILPITPVRASNLQDIRQLLSTKECENCNLTNAGLVLADLSGANLTGANLTGANLSRANLTGANLTGANLTGASLFGANLTGANLTGAKLAGSDLRGAYLANAIALDANITEAQLIGVVGLPTNIGNAEDFYRLGVKEALEGNYKNAIDHYNRALSLNPNLAAAYFARSMAWADLGDLNRAMSDAKQAQELYNRLGSQEGQEIAAQLMEIIEFRQNPQELRARNGGVMELLESATPLLLRFLF
ncbi:MAG: pentapeptide repeat-containing protein [Arthrospira sp. SH-MAG29]|nr:pentapeptide repeat-containing protein [Arthrospira sp. SH-MAG29]MBS0017633.1 pentapeptide repeat-containing protein [Arthrospira sp. SH-MAG29]